MKKTASRGYLPKNGDFHAALCSRFDAKHR